MTEETLLTEKEAAELLRVTPACLRKRRARKQPPAFYKPARGWVRYRRADLMAFLEAKPQAD